MKWNFIHNNYVIQYDNGNALSYIKKVDQNYYCWVKNKVEALKMSKSEAQDKFENFFLFKNDSSIQIVKLINL